MAEINVIILRLYVENELISIMKVREMGIYKTCSLFPVFHFI